MHSKRLHRICPICFKGHLERRVKQVTSIYRGHSSSYEQPGDWCSHCDEGMLSGTDALATQAQLLAWRARIDKQEGD